MFSSSNNDIDPLSPSYPHFHSFFGHEISLPNKSNLLVNGLPVSMDSSSVIEVPSEEDNNIHRHLFCPNEVHVKKKERRDLVYTARGTRERRVRLSLNVAQRFFDLQDFLGFDKASKTIDWLIGKSNSAIEELKKHGSSGGGENCPDYIGKCEVLSYETSQNSKQKNLSKDFTPENISFAYSRTSIARESRARARERARTRTKQRICTRRVSDVGNRGSSLPILNRIDASKERNNPINKSKSCAVVSQTQGTCIIENSDFVKRKVKPYPISNHAYQNWETVEANVAPSLF